MKNIIVLALSLFSFTTFADEIYRCQNLQRANGWRDDDLVIKTSFFSGKIKGAQMITADLDGGVERFEDVSNPFTQSYAEQFKVNPEDVKAASKLKFKELRKSGLSTTNSIAVSESMLKFAETGYVHYYYRMCILGSCESSSYYFKCQKI